MSFSFWTTSIIVSMLSFMPPVWTQWMSASSAQTIRRSASWLPTYYVVILPLVVVGFIGIFSLPELERADTLESRNVLARFHVRARTHLAQTRHALERRQDRHLLEARLHLGQPRDRLVEIFARDVQRPQVTRASHHAQYVQRRRHCQWLDGLG